MHLGGAGLDHIVGGLAAQFGQVIELCGADSMVRGWNHRVGALVDALQRFGNAAEWIPDLRAVIVPPRWVGTVHLMFSVARFDEWTECQT